MLLSDERAQLVEFGRRTQRDQLTVGTSGNLSIRRGDLVAITPSGVPYESMTAESICVIDLEGNRVDGHLEPSSEVLMHTRIYQRTDAGAVVHSHPPYAVTLSVLVDELPPVHYLIAMLGGPVRVAPYARYGTRELADNSLHAMAGRQAAILQNHGATTYGDSLPKAYTRTIYLEWLCRIYYQARLLGEPHLLSMDEINSVRDLLATYGQDTESAAPAD